MSTVAVSIVVAVVVIVLAFYLVEILRRRPITPEQLRWAPEILVRYVEVNSVRLRYMKAGQGPVPLLLHTLRTQLDLFQKVVLDLAKNFTNYPGHGYSDIPSAKYDAPFFADAVEGFLDALELRDVTLAGVSIGASISLILAV
jgi:pimeloyl-ACP methyl ester carboxylesterase